MDSKFSFRCAFSKTFSVTNGEMFRIAPGFLSWILSVIYPTSRKGRKFSDKLIFEKKEGVVKIK